MHKMLIQMCFFVSAGAVGTKMESDELESNIHFEISNLYYSHLNRSARGFVFKIIIMSVFKLVFN